jgi:hypothetical protein
MLQSRGPLDVTDELWNLERCFWLEGYEFYLQRMDPSALMIFPRPAGVLTRDQILESMNNAQRWRSVDMTGRSVARSGQAAVLAYTAVAERDGSDTYAALCGSTYVNENGLSKILVHQQTPV